MIKYISFLIIFYLLYVNNVGQNIIKKSESNLINFDKNDYGLIFTTISINNIKVKAMIDFGDQHKLQLSSSFVDQLNIPTTKTDYKVGDVYGNEWDVYKGIANQLEVGTLTENKVEFTTQIGEMEGVSQQVGTEFNAVLGWGYFENYYTKINYSKNSFVLFEEADSIKNEHFRIPFVKEASQLIIIGKINNEEHNFMIDTGSPVNIIDSNFKEKVGKDILNLKLSDNILKINTYSQDLSVLSDLGIIGILGGEFLNDWIITINPKENILHFSK